MSKSNILLAIIAGATIGGIIAIVLKAEDALTDESQEGSEYSYFGAIAKQFNDKLSPQLEKAENKIKSNSGGSNFVDEKRGDAGIFL
jgi:hypothetical protein